MLRRSGLLAALLALAVGALGPAVAQADVGAEHSLNLFSASGVRYQQPDGNACVAAASLMMLNMAATSHQDGIEGSTWTPTTLYAVQESMLAYARANDTLARSGVGSDPHGWRNLMNYYGWGALDAGVYADQSYSSFDRAVRAVVHDLATYRLPVGLLMEAGYHAELVTGYRVAGEDPATGASDFVVEGLFLTDPWRSNGHVDDFVSYGALQVSGPRDVKFVPYTMRDSPYRDPIDGQVGRSEWYGKYVIVAPTKASAMSPQPTLARSQPDLGADPSTFQPLGPTRILDSRKGLGLSGPLVSGRAGSLIVAGQGGVPADATAVTLNATLVNESAAGYLSLTPTPDDDPGTSTLNAPRGDTRANGSTVPLGPGGTIGLTFRGPAGSHSDVLLDVTGAYVPSGGAGFTAVGPSRLLDTRSGVGLGGRFHSGVSRTLTVAGKGGVPKGATAVAVNVTVAGATAAGYLSLTPDQPDSSKPATSSLNFPAGEVRANNAVVALAKDGSLAITYMASPGSTTDVVLDVTGAYVPGSGSKFVPLTPTRFLDTRVDLGLSDDFVAAQARSLRITGLARVPTSATAAVVNLTTAGATYAGYLSLTTKPDDTPATSTLNFPASDVRANGAIAPLAGGSLGITYGAPVDSHDAVVLDVVGYLTP